MTRFSITPLALVILSVLTLIGSTLPVSAQASPTQTITLTRSDTTAILNEASTNSNGVMTQGLALGVGQFILTAKVMVSGVSLPTISVWKPVIAQGSLVFNVSGATTADGQTVSGATMQVLNAFASQVRMAFLTTLQTKGFAYMSYTFTAVSSTAVLMTLVVQPNADGQSISGRINPGHIPLSGQASPEAEVLSSGFSQNWAGYVVTIPAAGHLAPQGDITVIDAQWTIPTASCSTTDTASATWIGLDGYGDPTVEQVGTAQNCVSGQPVYYAWSSFYSQPAASSPVALRDRATLTVNAGDVISAEVKATGSDVFVVTLKDVTTGETFTSSQSVPGALRRIAAWITELPLANGKLLALTDFNVLQFSAASLTSAGHTGSIADPAWIKYPLMMISADSVTLRAQCSVLSADGASFNVSYINAN